MLVCNPTPTEMGGSAGMGCTVSPVAAPLTREASSTALSRAPASAARDVGPSPVCLGSTTDELMTILRADRVGSSETHLTRFFVPDRSHDRMSHQSGGTAGPTSKVGRWAVLAVTLRRRQSTP